MDYDLDDFLEHHGIKGMKWGVRREKVRQARAAKKESRSREKNWTKEYQQRGKLSDQELQKRVQRLRLENDFARLASEAKLSERKRAQSLINSVANVSESAAKASRNAELIKKSMKAAAIAAA